MSNPEHIEELKNEFFGRPYSFSAIPNTDQTIDLSANSASDGLTPIKYLDQEGGTVNFSHVPALFKNMIKNPNTLLIELDTLMDIVTDEERELFEKYLDSPDNSQDFSR
ncbi:MAG: hypothetical protein Q7R97_03475 [Candidatus Daviesbacteria bacterium]|nr:hypothetical protein [Candidatus Daviesbacteria bacterium]